MAFKDRIRNLRLEKGLSPSELAVAFNKSEGAVRSWEMKRSKPDADTLVKLAQYFNCTTDYLLGMPDTEGRIIEIKAALSTYSTDELLKEIRRRIEK